MNGGGGRFVRVNDTSARRSRSTVLPSARPIAARLTAAAVVLAAVLTACGGGEPKPTATTPAPTTSTPTATAPGTPTASASPTATPTPTPVADVVIDITVAGGKVSTADRTVKIKRGQSVALTITSDQADEVHVHGYDLTLDLVAGKPTTIKFDADQTGKFEVELHEAGTVLVRLEVAS